MKHTLTLFTALLLTPLAVQSDLRAFIRATVRDRPLREDVFQEVAMMLWRKFYRFFLVRFELVWPKRENHK
jgi:DNA-directed RNA polymerase specialized sigma24 family protein